MKVFANQVSFVTGFSRSQDSFDRGVRVEISAIVAGEHLDNSNDDAMTARQWEAFKVRLAQEFEGADSNKTADVGFEINESLEYIGWRDRMLVAGNRLDV